MIAFKPFQLCPADQRPLGIPLAYPWIRQECAPEDEAKMRRLGWSVMSQEDYDAYVESLTEDLDYYETHKVQLAVEKSINEAMAFGTQCLREFSAENVLLGITASGMTGTVLNTLQNVMQALLAGSLYEAINRIRSINSADYDGTFLNETRVLKFINKIEKYLCIPLSTSI